MKAMGWEAVIGLEIHAQLTCKSKIFSSSSSYVNGCHEIEQYDDLMLKRQNSLDGTS